MSESDLPEADRRMHRAWDRLNDARHHLEKWGWGMSPSEIRKAELRIERLAAKAGRMEIRRYGEGGRRG